MRENQERMRREEGRGMHCKNGKGKKRIRPSEPLFRGQHSYPMVQYPYTTEKHLYPTEIPVPHSSPRTDCAAAGRRNTEALISDFDVVTVNDCGREQVRRVGGECERWESER